MSSHWIVIVKERAALSDTPLATISAFAWSRGAEMVIHCRGANEGKWGGREGGVLLSVSGNDPERPWEDPEKTLNKTLKSLTGILSDWTAVVAISPQRCFTTKDKIMLQHCKVFDRGSQSLLVDRREKGPNRFYVFYRRWLNEPLAEPVLLPRSGTNR